MVADMLLVGKGAPYRYGGLLAVLCAVSAVVEWGHRLRCRMSSDRNRIRSAFQPLLERSLKKTSCRTTCFALE